MMWGEQEGMGWWMVLGSVWFVVFWGLVIWAVVSLTNRGEGRSRTDDDSPLDLAKRRYARGEIDRDQFEQLRRDLG